MLLEFVLGSVAGPLALLFLVAGVRDLALDALRSWDRSGKWHTPKVRRARRTGKRLAGSVCPAESSEQPSQRVAVGNRFLLGALAIGDRVELVLPLAHGVVLERLGWRPLTHV
ncbi:MAG TPA: hypothetical protein VNN79_12885 [Actinomycetota bacterium]|nr:hypothetical protein [Actinomycetota bacterium]